MPYLMQKMKSDSLHQYQSSEYGFWYYYDVEVPSEKYIAKSGDAVFYSHEIKSLDNTILYTKEALGTKSYLVDKEEIDYRSSGWI